MDDNTKKALNSFSERVGLKPWILGEDGRTPVRTDMAGYMDWAAKVGGLSVRVATDDIDGTTVSTVFLDPMSMARDDNRQPKLFETLVTDPEGNSGIESRYRTWEEAERGHAEIVAGLRPLPQPMAGPKR